MRRGGAQEVCGDTGVGGSPRTAWEVLLFSTPRLVCPQLLNDKFLRIDGGSAIRKADPLDPRKLSRGSLRHVGIACDVVTLTTHVKSCPKGWRAGPIGGHTGLSGYRQKRSRARRDLNLPG